MFLLIYNVYRMSLQESESMHERAVGCVCVCIRTWRMNPNISRLSSLILNDHCTWCCTLFKERKKNWLNNLSHYTTWKELGKRNHSSILSGKQNIMTAPWRNLCTERTGRNYSDELRILEKCPASMEWIQPLYHRVLHYRRLVPSFI